MLLWRRNFNFHWSWHGCSWILIRIYWRKCYLIIILTFWYHIVLRKSRRGNIRSCRFVESYLSWSYWFMRRYCTYFCLFLMWSLSNHYSIKFTVIWLIGRTLSSWNRSCRFTLWLLFWDKCFNCSCDEMITFWKCFLWFSSLWNPSSNKFIEIKPIRSISNILLKH